MSIKFEIYRNGERVGQFSAVGAMVVGPESVPMAGDVAFKDGLLQVGRNESHPLALSLLWEVGSLGTYEMETTRLAHRDQPYNLNVELARFRLMKIVQKQEDWNLFDFPRAERFGEKFREAQDIFADALGHLHLPEQASQLADQSLQISVELSEELSAFHGELLLHRRRNAGSISRHAFGCRIDSTIQNQKYKETLAEYFDHAVVPMSWKQLAPEEGKFEPGGADDWVELLAKRRVPIIAGPLLDLSENGLPDWMFIWEHDFETVRELAYEFVQKVVQRYRKSVSVWNVVAGLHTNSAFSLTFEQSIELTRLLVSQVKATLPSARTLVSITEPFGEYNSRGGGSGVPPMLYAEMVAQSGINFDAFGLELELGVPRSGHFARDLFQISCMLDKFSTIGRPVFLTALCVPGRSTPDAGDRSEGKLDPSLGGRWRRPWDPQLQAEWIDAVYRLALSKPYIESIAWGNLADINPSLPGGGLMDDMFKAKPGFAKIQEMRDQYIPRKKA